MIDIFLVHDDVERCAAIRSAVKSNPDMTLVSETQTGREGLFAAATILTGHPRMLIVRLNLGDMTGFDFINQVRQKAPDIYIIPALEGTEGGQVWQNLLQLELRDVLVGPIPVPEIAKVLASAGPRAQEKFERNRAPASIQGESFVISVVSARGGIGKSVIATNLAAAIAKLSDSVTLLDFSLTPGDFAVMLDDVPRNNIMDAVQQGGSLDAEYLNNTLAPHPRLRFRYLASPNQEFDPSGFDYNVGLAIMQATKTLSQYVVGRYRFGHGRGNNCRRRCQRHRFSRHQPRCRPTSFGQEHDQIPEERPPGHQPEVKGVGQRSRDRRGNF